MKRVFKLLWRTMKWGFIVFCLFLGSLCFRDQTIPQAVLSKSVEAIVPKGLVLHIESVTFGFWHGLRIRSLRLYDRENLRSGVFDPLLSAESICVQPFSRRVEVDTLVYRRLPAGYYAPGNTEKKGRVDIALPNVPRFELVLNRPDILSVRPEKVVADILVTKETLSAERIRLVWPDKDELMSVEGQCRLDLCQQKIAGEIRGTAKQRHIRPLLETLDIPSALTYIDAFTEVPGKVPSYCGWKVDLTNNDLDLDLEFDPNMGKYNGVPMRHANGRLHLHVYTRGNCLNYHHTFGPIVATGAHGQPLEGTVTVDGYHGTNTVTVVAKSGLPVAQLLKIGGFKGDYVGEDAVGDSSCSLEFRFPRDKCGNNAYLDGKGHVEVRNGQIMRLKGFKGLFDLLAEKVPGVSWLTDSTQATCDYVIRNGIVTTDNAYVEGAFYSLKMYGSYDSVKDKLDYTVRVQFTKQDTVMGRILHPLTWPFTKLLLEFRLTGASEHPEWEYISVIDRVMEVSR